MPFEAGQPVTVSAESGTRQALHAQWPLPQGVVDLFFEDALAKRDLEEKLRHLFRNWAYGELIPPTFEYADTLASEAGTQLAEEMYRFVDRDGRTLALRPDLTIPTARVIGSRLFDQPLPLRLFYVGPVFRYEPPQAGRQREFTQAGVELAGAATPEADAEVLALTVEALRVSGLNGFQIALGQMAYFRGLLVEVGRGSTLAGPDRVVLVKQLQRAVDRKSVAEVAEIMERLSLAHAVQQALLALPTLNGGPAVLEQGRAHCLNDQMAGALDRLGAIQRLLAAHGVADAITFDLGETRGMEYYTGITFKAYTPGLGFSICSGGRYDDLVGHFGPPQPAVGCALWVDRLLLARQRQGGQQATRPPDLLLAAGDCAPCLHMAGQLRQQGLRVELEVTGRQGDSLLAFARVRGIARIAVCQGPERLLLVQGTSRRLTDPQGLVTEATQW